MRYLAENLDFEKTFKAFPEVSEEDIKEMLYKAASLMENSAPTPSLNKNMPKNGNENCIYAYVDGASSGNPGPAGIGILFYNPNNGWKMEISEFIGEKTNNLAEYVALREALKRALFRNITRIKIFSDSELVVNQIKGKWKTKDKELWEIVQQIWELMAKFEYFEIIHIPREENRRADWLAKLGISTQKKS